MNRKPRYIDADKLLEDIEKLDATNYGYFHEVVNQILVSMSWLVGKQQPVEVKSLIHGKWEPNKSEIPTGWIPVSERLPEECDYRSCYEVEDGAVLWTNEEGLVGMGYYYESTKTWSDIEDNPIAVIAWMSLPGPYEPQGGEDKE